MTQSMLKRQSPKTNQSSTIFDEELVNAIRDGKLVQIPWSELTSDEKRSAHVAMFHQWGW